MDSEYSGHLLGVLKTLFYFLLCIGKRRKRTICLKVVEEEKKRERGVRFELVVDKERGKEAFI